MRDFINIAQICFGFVWMGCSVQYITHVMLQGGALLISLSGNSHKDLIIKTYPHLDLVKEKFSM